MANSVLERHERGREIILSDRLSNLPDPLLQHILSFLPTKDAIATSFLSKRWISLWIGLPILHLDDSSFRSSKSFVQFAEYALKLFTKFNHIQIFRLKRGAHFGLDPDKIMSWVKAVINKLQAEELELCFTSLFGISLSSSIFNGSIMKVLKLKFVKVNTLSSVNLPSLEVLHLERVLFPEFQCLVMLLTACPLLEELKLSSFVICDYHKIRTKGTKSLQHYLVSSNNPTSSFLVTLKKFCVDQFKGLGCEYLVAGFIVKRAKALRTFSVICRTSVNPPMMLKKLYSFPKGSENCRILFQVMVPYIKSWSDVKFQSCDRVLARNWN